MTKLSKFFLCVGAALCLIAVLAACQAANSVATPSQSAPDTLEADFGPTPVFAISGVTLPENYRTDYIHYATVERPDGIVRDIYINPESAANMRAGYAIPQDTTIVIEAFFAQRSSDGDIITDDAGHYVRDTPLEMIHVAQKRGDWAESDFVSNARNGDWNYGTFDYASSEHFEESVITCFTCHSPTQNTDFVYTYPDLTGYLRSNQLQQVFCDQTGRTPCD